MAKYLRGTFVVFSSSAKVSSIPYMAKNSMGKTFAFKVENGYSLEKFCGRLILPIDKAIICGKNSRLNEKL